MGEELSWFEQGNERVLGFVIRDRTDNDFAGMVLARDEILQYRWIESTKFVATQKLAEIELETVVEEAAAAPDEKHYQGHEIPGPVDFFTPVVSEEQLNPSFKTIINEEGFSPALGIMEPMMRWYNDVDGNFIEQFQTTGFDARVWELYIFATLVELGFIFDRNEPAPDFVASSLRGVVAIEAVTVNPTKDQNGHVVAPPPVDTPKALKSFLREYMPIKFGSALYSKLCKEYWKKPHIKDVPLVFAIEDFSAPPEVASTRSSLQTYLYGYENDHEKNNEGKLIVKPRRIESHNWNDKTIPSGFFFLPDAEKISAVIFSNSGTISKFNRMGFMTRFGSNRVQMKRIGVAANNDPNATTPVKFEHDISLEDYSESWVEGLEVYHNPQAAIPLDAGMFPGAAHIQLSDSGEIMATLPEWHPLSSRTFVGMPKWRSNL